MQKASTSRPRDGIFFVLILVLSIPLFIGFWMLSVSLFCVLTGVHMQFLFGFFDRLAELQHARLGEMVG